MYREGKVRMGLIISLRMSGAKLVSHTAGKLIHKHFFSGLEDFFDVVTFISALMFFFCHNFLGPN